MKLTCENDLSTDKDFMCRLHIACEQAKRTLSSASEATVQATSPKFCEDFRSTITRARFEALNSDLFRSTIETVVQVLAEAKMDKSSIDEIVLVGGSTRIPKIQTLLVELFNGKEVNKRINPDEAVAYGAAVQAAVLRGDKSDALQTVTVQELTPLSLGIETQGEVMSVVVKRNTPIPTRKNKNFTTCHDNQTSVRFKVHEGERAMSKDNTLLGEFVLSEIVSAPRGVPSFDVTFEINADGMLHVSALDKLTRCKRQITVNYEDRLSEYEIEEMMENSRKYHEEDELQRDRVLAKNSFESFVFGLKNALEDEDFKDYDIPLDEEALLDKCEEAIEWLDANKMATKEEFQQEQNELERLCDAAIVEKYQSWCRSSLELQQRLGLRLD
ncbi:unnamed protein product [Darwinula stevensoni]|uniref:Heat shock protein 70 n=1 Tax=Darwinula stevensoni TaxID=69355 RepID=A0A7R9A6Q2_9CRUS|nr:unnamed protein product [Darwinula stevensoni]CAG0889974.1 unnamed protein product [Darwinula stevensoni]